MKYLPEEKDYQNYYYIDVEGDSLTPTQLWMMCASRLDQDEVHSFIGHTAIKRFFDETKDAYFVGHNSISFDGPVLGRLLSINVNSSNTIDTLVLSQLYNPSLPGGHSLAAWGERLKDLKGDFHDFSKYSEEMDKYCQQDVRLGKKVFKGLVTRMRRIGYSELSCRIEHEIREVVDEQQRNGWYFDIPGAQSLVSRLRAEQTSLEGPIHELFPPRLRIVNTYQRRTKKDGSEFGHYVRHLEEYPKVTDNLDGTYSTWDWEEFNINSPAQRLSRLLEFGYEPQSFTEKGNPKVDEESLIAFAESSGIKEVQAIADCLVLQGRATMVEGWLNCVNYDDHRMHGRVWTCGAVTRRMRHDSPNSANIPKAKDRVKYGKECRSLWQATPGRLEVGADASGLELRMFAEYLKNDEATKLYIEGDPHLTNTRNLGYADEMRDLTIKNSLYCFLYGGGDKKLGKTTDPSIVNEKLMIKEGKRVRSILTKSTPGLARLVDDIDHEYKAAGGLLKTIDGGFVRCTSTNAALNYKLQSAGAIVMKEAAIILRNHIRKSGLDGFFIGNVHDEFQLDCSKKDAEEVGKAAVQSITEAGESLGFKVPLTGAWKSGPNWASTH